MEKKDFHVIAETGIQRTPSYAFGASCKQVQL